jgi:adenylate kinase
VGKTTIAARIAERFGLLHVNAGDLLFDEVRKCSPLGRRAKRFLDASHLLPDAVFNEMIGARLDRLDVKEFGYVLDGYPHNKAQVEYLNDRGLVPDKVRGSFSFQVSNF